MLLLLPVARRVRNVRASVAQGLKRGNRFSVGPPVRLLLELLLLLLLLLELPLAKLLLLMPLCFGDGLSG